MDVYLRKTSLVDYPGKVAAVLFFRGCNLRCPWCHNRELVLPKTEAAGKFPGGAGEGDFISQEAAFDCIKRRRSVLGGVVLSGGEPCLCRELGPLILRIRDLGLPIKLDTNGMRPDVLEALFSKAATRPDYIALDLKTAPERYGELLENAGGRGPADRDPGEALRKSASLIRKSGITCEFRSIVFPNGYFGLADIDALAPLVGDSPWYFRSFRPGNCLDPSWNEIGEPEPGHAAILAEAARNRTGGRFPETSPGRSFNAAPLR
ncbi:MAG: anaerobic ribonucleoside-triphosphate reductase activating protein [Spirochaetaceae bacterium]|jgi:pyruvate formate lyase activating enzyme|nr:anaerobic ribonucleoside-triphosphate reductase activating protein [Spirochaetaceae bacterium]